MVLDLNKIEQHILIQILLNENMCDSGCFMNYKHIDCDDWNEKKGCWTCQYRRTVQDLLNKLGENK